MEITLHQFRDDIAENERIEKIDSINPFNSEIYLHFLKKVDYRRLENI